MRNILRLYQKNPQLGHLVLRLVSRLVPTLDDLDGSRKLYDQLVPLAAMLADNERINIWPSQEEEISTEDHVRDILEASIYVSIAAYPDQPLALTFSNVLRNLIDVNPMAAVIARSIVHHLCRDLPLVQAQYFWPLLFRLRAE